MWLTNFTLISLSYMAGISNYAYHKNKTHLLHWARSWGIKRHCVWNFRYSWLINRCTNRCTSRLCSILAWWLLPGEYVLQVYVLINETFVNWFRSDYIFAETKASSRVDLSLGSGFCLNEVIRFETDSLFLFQSFCVKNYLNFSRAISSYLRPLFYCGCAGLV